MDMASIGAMNARQCAANTVSIRRNEDEVNMVGHQHPAPDLYASGATMMGQEIAIERIVIIAKEGLRPPVAALGDVMWNIRGDDASETGHWLFWSDLEFY
jgi:hypothetical protein